jgi:hypothetical protein
MRTAYTPVALRTFKSSFAGMVKITAPAAAAQRIVRYMVSSLTLKFAATHQIDQAVKLVSIRPWIC